MNAQPLRVWLVDDDASIRWVLEKALKSGGMSPKSFEAAEPALAALRSDTPDVLVRALATGRLERFHRSVLRVLPSPEFDRYAYASMSDMAGFARHEYATRDLRYALAAGSTALNRCPPGGEATILRLAERLGQPPRPLDPECGTEGPTLIAWIDAHRCIGCARCLPPCPVDAILGAIADGDIGSHFPPSDDKWKGAESNRFLDYAVQRVRARGGFVANLASGLPYFLAMMLGYTQADAPGHTLDYGSKFLVVAGLLNLLCVVDAFEIATGRKD